METDPTKNADENIVRLAQAERDAGVPDVRTAAAAADARQRRDDTNAEVEAHPS